METKEEFYKRKAESDGITYGPHLFGKMDKLYGKEYNDLINEHIVSMADNEDEVIKENAVPVFNIEPEPDNTPVNKFMVQMDMKEKIYDDYIKYGLSKVIESSVQDLVKNVNKDDVFKVIKETVDSLYDSFVIHENTVFMKNLTAWADISMGYTYDAIKNNVDRDIVLNENTSEFERYVMNVSSDVVDKISENIKMSMTFDKDIEKIINEAKDIHDENVENNMPDFVKGISFYRNSDKLTFAESIITEVAKAVLNNNDVNNIDMGEVYDTGYIIYSVMEAASVLGIAEFNSGKINDNIKDNSRRRLN